MTDMTVANTILAQLGGNRFLAMTGAKNLVGSRDALTMKLPGNMTKGRITHVRVTLTPMDEYTVEGMRIRGTRTIVMVDRREGVYADTLQSIFTDMTGLYTRF